MSEVERVVIGPRSHFHEEVERSAKELKELKEYKKYLTVTVTKNIFIILPYYNRYKHLLIHINLVIYEGRKKKKGIGRRQKAYLSLSFYILKSYI